MVQSVVFLWSDVRIWLLSPTNVTFGLASAFMNGYFNANYATKELGAQTLGYLTAFTVCCSCICAKLIGLLPQDQSRYLTPLFIGCAAFALIPVMIWSGGCCRGWSCWILAFYALQGVGRGVFENTNKAMFADTFNGPDAESAFATSTIQLGVSSATCFFLSDFAKATNIEVAMLIFALLMPLFYAVKLKLEGMGDLTASKSETESLIEKFA